MKYYFVLPHSGNYRVGGNESLHLLSILENPEGLNEDQRTAAREKLQEFQDLFSTSDSDVDRCNMTQHRINTEDWKLRVCHRFRKSLGKPERNDCVPRKELLVILKSIEHFHHYLYGRNFLLRTHHASHRWLLNFREPEGQRARWIQRLQEYDFEIQHRKGTYHGNADALSRRPCKESCKHCTNAEKKFGMKTDISVKVVTTEGPWSSSEVQKAQLGDPATKPI
ncbi:hypothetical protein AVEN_151682-1 [Araneus ventricosus]|uniref:Reverse transcriptase RNase H-like domain-containing protein n=1 Tax=Araneus ventricosus TaxID=182803 RepID=A0A4Y2R702_ARAVE|nr:hypothetical protein AVEN_151682-1 [Araneus ventricosus]